MKASSKVLTVLQIKNRPIAANDFGGMKNETDEDGNITGFPTIEAICDALSIKMECVDRFEVSSRPTMRVALPMLFKAIKDLDSVAGGATVVKKDHCVWSSLQYNRSHSVEICANISNAFSN